MCGRYALSFRPREIRRRFEESYMPVEEAPEDDDIRQSYNFAPGYHGLVYRADTPDSGAGPTQSDRHTHTQDQDHQPDSDRKQRKAADVDKGLEQKAVKYKLQAMKWGLIPFWTKRSPDYGSMIKTINCRDDSLLEDRGMWTTMKKRKRCIVVAQGFYEWLKKNNGKEKIPHYIKRKDGQLMCFAGLWDCVKYEGSEEKLYTYTIITTDANKQINFLHDRMPVILDNGSDAVRTWLNPGRSEWSKELQSLLKPYEGELEIYPVVKDVGKVGNNSPTFIVPLDSKENKNNIANFFDNQKKAAQGKDELEAGSKVKEQDEQGSEHIKTVDDDNSTEDNAPKPVPSTTPGKSIKQEPPTSPAPKSASPRDLKREHDAISPSKAPPSKTQSSKRIRSATSNGTTVKSPSKAGDGSKKITAFFGK